MIKINIKNLLLIVLLSVMIIPVLHMLPAQAGLWEGQIGMGTETGEIGETFEYTDDPSNIQLLVGRIIKTFLGLLGIIFLILILLAGYRWMTARGAEDEISKAKSQLQSSIIGLAIILMAYAVTYFVTEFIYKATIK